MKKLYAPWRQAYAGRIHAKEKSACIFCQAAHTTDDKKYFVIRRYKHCFLMLNTYPYNAGHIMIISNEHCADLAHLSVTARTELMHAINDGIQLLKKTLKPESFNVGINLGKFAGAGIPDHLHVHIVPRWQGDTNFMPIIAQTKQISFDLHEIYKKLTAQSKKFDKI